MKRVDYTCFTKDIQIQRRGYNPGFRGMSMTLDSEAWIYDAKRSERILASATNLLQQSYHSVAHSFNFNSINCAYYEYASCHSCEMRLAGELRFIP